MPAVTVPKNSIAIGAGYLYIAALGSTLPTNTVVGSVFTDTWPVAWNLLGITKSGSEFTYTITTDIIDSAEYFDPLQIVTTARAAQWAFELEQVNATTLKNALNGGSLVTSGAGTTLLSTYTPPAAGAEVRTMIGWEAQDNTERLVMEQAFQAGAVKLTRNKGAANATIPVEFHAELPASGFPFRYWTAGTVRG
jgi:hypothetical protein